MMDNITSKAGDMPDKLKDNIKNTLKGMTQEQLDKLSEYFEISPATFESWESFYDILKKIANVDLSNTKVEEPEIQDQTLEGLKDNAF